MSWHGHFSDYLCSTFRAICWIACSSLLYVSRLCGPLHQHIQNLSVRSLCVMTRSFLGLSLLNLWHYLLDCSLPLAPRFTSIRFMTPTYLLPLWSSACRLCYQAPPITPFHFISNTSLGHKRPNPPIGFVSNFAPKCFTHIYTAPDHIPLYFLIKVSLSGNYYHMLLLSETY